MTPSEAILIKSHDLAVQDIFYQSVPRVRHIFFKINKNDDEGAEAPASERLLLGELIEPN